ncbi:hypothetical protein [Phaeobacter inhibens]|uniref:hypothetical protein n=1 Tax=Phaeobacter inhibens TaxID=221822 RepID=UPI00295F2D07|nr:hypothetical protein [Phaeobacter inhibens]
MDTKWISIKKLKEHEFHTTLRHIRASGENWHSSIIRLSEILHEAITRAMKLASSLFVIYLVLTAFGDENTVSVTVSGVTASLPTGYVTVAASLILFIAIQHLQTCAMLISTLSNESLRVRLRGFNSGLYKLYHGKDEMALVTPVVLNQFLSPKLPTTKILNFLTQLVYFSALFPFLGMWTFLFKLQLKIVLSGEIPSIHHAAACFGAFTLAAAAVFVVLFNTPLPMKKNAYGIRWGLLSTLHPVGQHPMLARWFDEGNKAKST